MSNYKKIEQLEKKIDKLTILVDSLIKANYEKSEEIERLNFLVEDLNTISLSNILIRKNRKINLPSYGLNLTWKRSRELRYARNSVLIKQMLKDPVKSVNLSNLSLFDLGKAIVLMYKKINVIGTQCIPDWDTIQITTLDASELLTLNDIDMLNELLRGKLSILENFLNVIKQEVKEEIIQTTSFSDNDSKKLTIDLLTISLNLTLKRIQHLENILQIN